MQYLEPLNDIDESDGDSDLENLDNNGNKIYLSQSLSSNEPKNPIFKIRKFGRFGKQQKQTKIDLPESVRILGVHFDPGLYFNDHLKIVKSKVEKKFHCLLKLAFCRYYHFKPSTIYKYLKQLFYQNSNTHYVQLVIKQESKKLVKFKKERFVLHYKLTNKRLRGN